MRIDQITNCIENGRFWFRKIQSSIATLLCNSSPQILGETGKYVRNLYCLGKGDWIIQELAIVHPSLNVGSGGGRNKLFSLADSDRIYWNLPIHPFHKEQQQLYPNTQLQPFHALQLLQKPNIRHHPCKRETSSIWKSTKGWKLDDVMIFETNPKFNNLL